MARLADLAFPFRVEDLPLLALAIQDVPRPLWSDVALRRLRGAPGVQADLLNVKTLEGVYKKLFDKAPHLLGKTSAHGPVLTSMRSNWRW